VALAVRFALMTQLFVTLDASELILGPRLRRLALPPAAQPLVEEHRVLVTSPDWVCGAWTRRAEL